MRGVAAADVRGHIQIFPSDESWAEVQARDWTFAHVAQASSCPWFYRCSAARARRTHRHYWGDGVFARHRGRQGTREGDVIASARVRCPAFAGAGPSWLLA